MPDWHSNDKRQRWDQSLQKYFQSKTKLIDPKVTGEHRFLPSILWLHKAIRLDKCSLSASSAKIITAVRKKTHDPFDSLDLPGVAILPSQIPATIIGARWSVLTRHESFSWPAPSWTAKKLAG